MHKIEQHAIHLVSSGGESAAEDDLDEMETFTEDEEGDWRASTELGVDMAQAIKNHPESFLAWFRSASA